ncbi:MAG: LysM peptidoglycan-binding domain-containing protein [Bacteroidetes bacterium]|jgi:LysM repeat protein|nr:LysM peptidoglycan-binding domain-containing protein [Bacteroidota bacterium]
MANNCPICNKAGLSDYTKNNVVCPQCNSDLKAFMLLNSISKPNKSKIGIYLIIGVSLLSVVFLGLFLKSNSDKKELIAKNVILNDSISKIQIVDVVKETTEEVQPIAEKQEATIKYVVKKGDYPYKIAQFFYNDGSKYTQIEADNNLEQPYILKVGQILTIKIPHE